MNPISKQESWPDKRVKITDTLGSKSEREEYYLKRRICKNE